MPPNSPDRLDKIIKKIPYSYRALTSEPVRKPALNFMFLINSVAETAAEKLVSLTRRTAMQIAGVSREPDPTLVRHIYDLHMIREHYSAESVARLAKQIIPLDAEEFGNQFPSYRDNPEAETRRALAALSADSQNAQQCAGLSHTGCFS